MLQKLTRSPLQKALLILTVVLSVILQSPSQPEVDWAYYSKLASAHTSNEDKDSPLTDVKIVITGATSGLGLSLSKKLYSLGGTVIAVGRSKSKLAALEETLRTGSGIDTNQKEGQGQGKVVSFVADFQDLESVSSAAQDIQEQFQSIDFLVNNAGMYYNTYSGGKDLELDRTTPQGFDMLFAVNYLSHFLLTEELLPALNRSMVSSGPRIVQISSGMHVQVSGDDLVPTSSNEDNIAPSASQPSSSILHSLRAYGNSKLAQIYHARSLTRELLSSSYSSSMKIVSICPSWVATNIGGKDFKKTMDVMAFNSDTYGITSILYAMFHPDVGLKTGGKNEERYNDFVTNSNVGDLMMRIPMMERVFRFDFPEGLRMFTTWFGAIVIMCLQRFFADVEFSTTFAEAFDETKQDALYAWSKEAVESFRKKKEERRKILNQ